MKMGAHVSLAGRIGKAIDRGVEIGAEAVQLFCSPPQGWAFKSPTEGIGIAGFEVIMTHCAFRDIPFLLEVPGTDKKGPDRKQLDLAKDARARAGVK